MMELDAVRVLQGILEDGDTVAIGDGTGAPTAVLPSLMAAGAAVGDVTWFLGWMFDLPVSLPHPGVSDAVTYMGGYALRRPIEDGTVRYLPERLGHLPTIIARKPPDVVVVSARRRGRDLVLGSEVSWVSTAMRDARRIVAVLNDRLPDATADVCVPDDDRVVVLTAPTDGPISVPESVPGAAETRIAAHLADLIAPGATIQFPPGKLGTALLDAVRFPIHIDSGLLTDAVVRLDERGLLATHPTATYLVGSGSLYRWADGRKVIHPVEWTHNTARLLRLERLLAINTALEIDVDGQVNVQRIGHRALAGIGGQPDYAAAAARHPGGASIIAVPTSRGGHSTLVERLSAPASLSRVDVQIVVTEQGVADLRGLDEPQRRAALHRLWRGVGIDRPDG